MNKPSSVKILDGVIATGYSAVHQQGTPKTAFHASGKTSAGAGSATVIVQGSAVETPVTANDGDWVTLGTITLTLGTTRVSDGFATDAAWRHVRVKLSAISGTDAEVDCWLGG